jgi:hypothetical protein
VQVLANFLSTPLASGLGGDAAGWPYVAFDLDPSRVKVIEIHLLMSFAGNNCRKCNTSVLNASSALKDSVIGV